MLIKNLGQTRKMLLESIKDLSDEQINEKIRNDKWSISQVLYHLYLTEKNTGLLILNSLNTKSTKVEDRDLSFLADRSKKAKAPVEPPADFFRKAELIANLEESRFEYLQAVFNETHEKELTEISVNHPALGPVSLKNMMDFIWLHEKRHLGQIEEMKQELATLKHESNAAKSDLL